MNKTKLFEVADRQLGYFTSKQAEQCGYHRAHFHRFVQSGEWVKELRGVYRLSYYPIQDRPELVLWTLWSRNKQGTPQGIWSYETALDIYEITDVMPSKMHMTVPVNFRRNQTIPDVLELHYQDLTFEEFEVRQGYCVTTPLRTLVDIIQDQSVPVDQIILGIKQALQQGLISKNEIKRSQFSDILLRYIHDGKI